MRNLIPILCLIACITMAMKESTISVINNFTKATAPIETACEEPTKSGEEKPVEPDEEEEETVTVGNTKLPESVKYAIMIGQAQDFEHLEQFVADPGVEIFDEAEGYEHGTADERLAIDRVWTQCSDTCLIAGDDFLESGVYPATGGFVNGECACKLRVEGSPSVYVMSPDEMLDYAEGAIQRYKDIEAENQQLTESNREIASE